MKFIDMHVIHVRRKLKEYVAKYIQKYPHIKTKFLISIRGLRGYSYIESRI